MAHARLFEERVSQEDFPRQGERDKRLALEVLPALSGPARRKSKAPFVPSFD